MKRLVSVTVSVLIFVFCLTVQGLEAQAHLGGQVSFADDVDFGIGPRLVIDLPGDSNLGIIGSFDYFFPDTGSGAFFGTDIDINYWELNGNLVYLLELEDSAVLPYAGGGINFAHVSATVESGGTSESGSDSEIGLNILGGIQFPGESVTPFAELRIEASGGEQTVVTGGLLIPLN